MSQESTASDSILIYTETVQSSSTIKNHASAELLTERTDLSRLDTFEYERQGSNPGRIIIFNQEFRDIPDKMRNGTRRDVNEIILCFQRLGFHIFEEDVLVEKTEEQIIEKLDSVIKDETSLKEANCLIIFFLTHGGPDNELYVKNGSINCTDIWSKFLNCSALNKKPKMFVFQACKGKYYVTVDGKPALNAINRHPSQLLATDSFTVTQMGDDMLMLFSTIEGTQSYRHMLTGSWLIQELCRNFSMYGRRDDVITMILRTIKCICGNYFRLEPDHEIVMKQMPIFASTLTKKFYLNRNKDRQLLLEINRKQDELLNILNKIEKFCRQQNASKK